MVGYYVLTVGASLLLVRETRSRLRDLRKGLRSAWYAPLPFGVVLVYVIVGFGPLDEIPILNWSWLGYNIAFGPYAGEGIWGILPFVPLLVYMFIHINYIEELYFRKSKKMVVAWALLHIAMGIKVHTALILIPIGFLFKYIYDKKGVRHAYAMHFAANTLVVVSLLLTTVAQAGFLGE
ncbi:hypothetical protein CENSYa_0489 [Cenarchaeum symbiosum A]|uniref:CPBP family intramembrane metalloprotease n=1 Tax=Cenarchaeum symbiosum (strain A) TaxID=414004 RepID=A0RUV6_CENSY|nr:hypothetical protein CENSYa_0489 [Cenarchaeum symbiosum A]